MLYMLVMVVAALATAAMTRPFPQSAIRIGVVAMAGAVVAVTVGEVTGNLFFFYLGSFAAPFGVLVLFAGAAGSVRNRDGAGS